METSGSKTKVTGYHVAMTIVEHFFLLISMRTASLAWQKQFQPHFHSKARQLSAQLQNDLVKWSWLAKALLPRAHHTPKAMMPPLWIFMLFLSSTNRSLSLNFILAIISSCSLVSVVQNAITVVLCKKRVEKTANVREMRPFWKLVKMATMQRHDSQFG